jgi:hypothetical protein
MTLRKIGVLSVCVMSGALLGVITRPDLVVAQRSQNPVATEYTYQTVAAAELQNSPYAYVWIVRTEKNTGKAAIAYCITYDSIAHPDAKQPECSAYKPL